MPLPKKNRRFWTFQDLGQTHQIGRWRGSKSYLDVPRLFACQIQIRFRNFGPGQNTCARQTHGTNCKHPENIIAPSENAEDQQWWVRLLPQCSQQQIVGPLSWSFKRLSNPPVSVGYSFSLSNFSLPSFFVSRLFLPLETGLLLLPLAAFGSAAVWGILTFSLGPKPSKKVSLLLLYAVHSPPPSPRTYFRLWKTAVIGAQRTMGRDRPCWKRLDTLEQLWLWRRHLM